MNGQATIAERIAALAGEGPGGDDALRWEVRVLDPTGTLGHQRIVIYSTPVGVVMIPPQCGYCILPPAADAKLGEAIWLARETFDAREMGGPAAGGDR